MEAALGSYEKEYMKMAMLKHEETFKEQVYELHRLYRIQKILMRSIGNSVHPFAGNTSASSSICCMDNKAVAILNYMNLQQERPAESDHGVVEADADAIEEKQVVELTLGLRPTTTYPKKRGSTSDSIPTSFSSSSTGSTRSFDIHHRDNGVVVEAGDSMSASADRLKHPPSWVFQFLQLNSTR